MTTINEERITFDFACRDDCPLRMVPSDLRKLIVERDAAETRAEKAEAERDVLVNVLDKGVSDCPYLTFLADGADLEIPDWCTCSDTDEYGFECNVDAKDCWLNYAQQHARSVGDARP